MEVAETVQRVAREPRGVEVELIENPRRGEALADSFEVSTTKAETVLWWVRRGPSTAALRAY
jgi:hypothetical protein